jgi:hypothetical protein
MNARVWLSLALDPFHPTKPIAKTDILLIKGPKERVQKKRN